MGVAHAAQRAPTDQTPENPGAARPILSAGAGAARSRGALGFEQARKRLSYGVVGEIQIERRDGNPSRIDGAQIAALRGHRASPLEGQPIVGVAPGVLPLIDVQQPWVAASLACHADARHLVWLAIGEVDVL